LRGVESKYFDWFEERWRGASEERLCACSFGSVEFGCWFVMEGSLLEERNVGSVEALHLDWELYNFLLQMQRWQPDERWRIVTRPSVDLALSMDNVFFDEERHHLFHLVSRYFDVVYGHVIFEGDSQRDIVQLKWLVTLNHLAGSSLVMYPVSSHLLYGDDQWLPGRQQWVCLQPPYLPGGFSLDKIPFQPSEVKSRLEEVEAVIASFLRDVIEDEQYDFLTLLMGWILCPGSFGWHSNYDWNNFPPDYSIEARTFRLWEALLFLQKIIDREKPPSPAAETLQILKWACLLHDVVTGSYCPDLDQGSDGWLDFLGVTCPV